MFSRNKLPEGEWLPFWSRFATMMCKMPEEEYQFKTRDDMIVTKVGGWLALDQRGYPYFIPDGDHATYYADNLTRDLMALARRDELVRKAFVEDISKSEIHRLTGLARTTIDRILEKEEN